MEKPDFGKIELLAPGGDTDSIKAAILAGADAIYCGLDKFNARNRAANISFQDLQGVITLAHNYNCKVFLTLNILFVDNEFPALIKLLNELVNTPIDGVIVQDIGLSGLLSDYFPSLEVHASTQFNTHNAGQLKFLNKLHVSRVNLARELNIDEIKPLNTVAHDLHMETEVFVHGSYCISFSGICYMSAVLNGNSGNRGRCSQPCRERYLTTKSGNNYPLNLKDNSAWYDLRKLQNAGVDSIKIEGRIKKYEYVYTVVNAWRRNLNCLYESGEPLSDNSDLYKVFNRGFSNGFLADRIDKDMFTDDPRDNTINHLIENNIFENEDHQEEAIKTFLNEKEEDKTKIREAIDSISISKIPVDIDVHGQDGNPLKVVVKLPDNEFVVMTDANLSRVGKEPVSERMLFQRLRAINGMGYYIREFSLALQSDELYIPFRDLTHIKNRILYLLNGSKAMIPSVSIPKPVQHNSKKDIRDVSVLISSPDEIRLPSDDISEIYFLLPESMSGMVEYYSELLAKYPHLIPWFPPILIGEDYDAAIELLFKLKSRHIVTDNSGVAIEAMENGISWLAGPKMNIANSYSMRVLKDCFQCFGAFLSNEMSEDQIKNIRSPEDFRIYSASFQRVELMTSRQCLFQQVTGCSKTVMDKSCVSECEKSATITNLKKETFLIEKRPGFYNRIYRNSKDIK